MKNLNKALIGLTVFLVLVIAVYAHGNGGARQGYTSGHMFDAEEMDEMHDVMFRYIDDPELKEAMDEMHESHEQFYEGNANTGIMGHMVGMA